MDRDRWRSAGTTLVVLTVSALPLCAVHAKPPPAPPPQFEVVLIETPLGQANDATDINNRGQVVGSFFDPVAHESRGFLWTQDSGLVDLGVVLQGGRSEAQAINECGEIAGWSEVPSDLRLSPALWRAPNDLEIIADVQGAAAGINERGHIVGNFLNAANQIHAFLWTPEEGIIDLGTLGTGDDASFAYDLNNRDEVVGTSFTTGGQHAFLWTRRGGIRDLGALDNETSEAHGINDARQVTGFTHIPIQVGSRAFLWTARRGMVALDVPDLGPPDHLGDGHGWDNNARGEIAGDASFPELGHRAALWTRAGQLVQVDLDTTPALSSLGNAINDRGDVVGQQDHQSFGQRAVLWRVAGTAPKSPTHDDKLCRKR
jgi:probable HAF family extracellular repeat protein